MRVLVVLDMEGICGITDYRQCFAAFPEYWTHGRRAITAEVNALGRALLAAGAGEVHVLDGHAAMRNVLRGQVIPGVVVHDPFYVWHRVPERLRPDAVFLCGLHAHAGAPGFMPHTIAPRLKIRVNGRVIGEAPWAVWGLAGLPVIGASGDAALAATLREQLPGLPVTVVKEWRSRTAAGGDPEAGRRELAAAAARGLRHLAAAPRFDPPADFTLELSCGTPAAAAAVAAQVGGERTSDRVVAVRLHTWAEAVNFIGRAIGPVHRHGPLGRAAGITPPGVSLAPAAGETGPAAGTAVPAPVAAGDPWVARLQDLYREWMETPEPEWEE